MGVVALSLQPGQHSVDQLEMLSLGAAVNDDVVDKHVYPSVQSTLQHSPHLTLESTWCVLHTERHHRGLIQTQRRTDSHQLTALGIDGDLVEALQQIELAEVLHTSQL